ncbi:MAG: Amuc_1099 family pilus-like system protein [Verrucomicrobiota bacterium]
MDWLKENYHKALGIVVAVICLIFGGMHIMSALNFDEKFPPPEEGSGAAIPTPPGAYVKSMQTLVRIPQFWEQKPVPLPGGKNKLVPLFVSVPIVEHADKLFDMSDPDEEPLRPPASNSWLIEHSLNYLSAEVLTFDPDGDGYDNLEEWKAKSSPVDEGSHPPYTDKLAFLQQRSRSHAVIFKANNHPDYQIEEATAADGKESGFFKLGDTLPLGRFKIENYEEKEGKNQFGITSDLSELTLRDLGNDKTFVIVLKRRENRPELFAEFDFILDPDPLFHVKEGEEFQLPKNSANRYKVLSVSENEVVIAPSDRLDQTINIGKGAIEIEEDSDAPDSGFAEPDSNSF